MGSETGHVWLVGMMGAGKTTVGRHLASRLGVPFVDVDDLIVREAGKTVPAIFAAEGEAGFRRRERRAIGVAARGRTAVIATGGGAVLDAGSVATMRDSGLVVLLEADVEVLAARGEPEGRPLLPPDDVLGALERIAADRADAYRDAAHVVVNAGTADPDDIAERIEKRWIAT